MIRTLKKRYEHKQVQKLHERITRIDERVLVEERTARLILEAMDEEDLNKVTAIIDKLRNIKRPELPQLTKAIEQAEAEINKYTSGGPLTKAWTKLKGVVGIDNPIVKVTTFANALERGFSQIPTILKNNGIDLKNVDLNKSLATALMGKTVTAKTGAKSDQEMAKSPFTGKEIPEADETMQEADVSIEGKLKLIVDQLKKALSPGGIYGVFKKVPYIDSTQLAQELVQAPIKVFAAIAKTVNQGVKAAEVAPDMKNMVAGKGDFETKAALPGDASKPSGQSRQSSPTTDTTAASSSKPTGERPPEPRGGGSQKGNLRTNVVKRIKPSMTKIGVKDVNRLVSMLDDLGVLKDPG